MKSYTQLAPCFAYLIRAGNTMTPGDFDGDGRVEIASYCATNNSLNMLAHFTYADVDPRWAAATQGQLINAWACLQAVPADPALDNAAPWTLQGGDVYLSAKLAGGAADFLVVFSPSRAMLGVLQWSGQQLQTEFVSPQGSLEPGVGFNAQDQFIVADIDGDGCDELVVYSPNDQWLFTLKWANGGFTCLTRQQYAAGQWPISSTDIYVKACQLPGGAWQIAAYNKNNNCSVTCLYLSGDQLLAQTTTNLKWPPFPDMIACGFATEENQPDPGLHTLVFYEQESNAYTPVYLIWSGAEPMWLTPDQVQISGAEQLLPAGLLGQGNDYLFSFDGPNLIASVSSQLSVVWTTGVSTGQIAPGVGLNAGDLFCVADVDGDGLDELVMLSQNDEWLFMLKWNASQNRFYCVTSMQTATQSWSVDLLAPQPPSPIYGQVPQTPMAPAAFQGNQLTIFQTVSPLLYKSVASNGHGSPADIRSLYPWLQASDFATLQQTLNSYVQGQASSGDLAAVAAALTDDFIYGYISETLDPGCGADIRAKYLDATYDKTNDFVAMSQQLSNGQIAQLAGTPAAAWSVMADQLASELLVVTSLNAWAGANVMGALINQNEVSSQGALGHAAGYVSGTNSPNNGDAILYWAEAIFDAAIWTAAALPGIPGLPIVLALAASLYGSYTAFAGSSNSPGPTEINYGEAVQDITNTFAASNSKVSAQKTQIGTDQVLLPLLGGLFSGSPDNDAWSFAQSDLTTLISAGVTPQTIQFYAMLIPERFNILIWQNVNQKEPFYCLYLGIDIYKPVNCNAPSYAYQVVDNGKGSYTIYLLCEGGQSDLDNLSYPTQAMFQDLNNLGIPTLDIVQGNGPWGRIPQTVLTLQCGLA
jgi:hypothetical protein